MNQHRREFERWLRHNNVPYVSVDEAKKAILASGTLHAFHYVVYPALDEDEPNLLCYVIRRPTADHRFNMRQWQEVFGDGFASCFVEVDEEPVFRWLDGESFIPSFMRNAEDPDEFRAAIAQSKADGDDIPLIQWLSENDDLYRCVEGAMMDAEEQSHQAEAVRLSDWLFDYRRALLDGTPTPQSPLNNPIPTPLACSVSANEPAPPGPHQSDSNPQPFTARLQLELFAGTP